MKDYSIKELMQIIRGSKKLGVNRLKIDANGIDVTFGDNVYQPLSNQAFKKQQQEIIELEAKDEIRRKREMELYQMDLESPEEYEQLLLMEDGVNGFLSSSSDR